MPSGLKPSLQVWNATRVVFGLGFVMWGLALHAVALWLGVGPDDLASYVPPAVAVCGFMLIVAGVFARGPSAASPRASDAEAA